MGPSQQWVLIVLTSWIGESRYHFRTLNGFLGVQGCVDLTKDTAWDSLSNIIDLVIKDRSLDQDKTVFHSYDSLALPIVTLKNKLQENMETTASDLDYLSQAELKQEMAKESDAAVTQTLTNDSLRGMPTDRYTLDVRDHDPSVRNIVGYESGALNLPVEQAPLYVSIFWTIFPTRMIDSILRHGIIMAMKGGWQSFYGFISGLLLFWFDGKEKEELQFQLNETLLNTSFRVRPHSNLKNYIYNRTGAKKENYLLVEILIILKEAIKEEVLYDQGNPSVILCNAELEEIFDMRAFHVSEITFLVLKHLEQVQNDTYWKRFKDLISQLMISNENMPITAHVIRTVRTSRVSVMNEHAKFMLIPNYLDFIRTIPGSDPSQTVFAYKEITDLMSRYIISRKDHIFDKRNIKVALVEDDPLGKLFGVRAFHRCQINVFIQNQLIPCQNDTVSEQALTTYFKYPRDSASITSILGPDNHSFTQDEENYKEPEQDSNLKAMFILLNQTGKELTSLYDSVDWNKGEEYNNFFHNIHVWWPNWIDEYKNILINLVKRNDELFALLDSSPDGHENISAAKELYDEITDTDKDIQRALEALAEELHRIYQLPYDNNVNPLTTISKILLFPLPIWDTSRRLSSDLTSIQPINRGGKGQEVGNAKQSRQLALCKNHLTGACFRGKGCKFTHLTEVCKNYDPGFETKCSDQPCGKRHPKLCRKFPTGHCKYGRKCHLVHPIPSND